MKINQVARTRWLVLGIALMLVLAGCQKKPEAKPVPPSSKQSEKAKPPQNTEGMLEEIDKILQALDKKARQERVPQMVETEPKEAKKEPVQDQGAQEKSSNPSQAEKDSGSDQQQQTSESQPAQPSPEQQPDPWKPETMSLMKVHEGWNVLEPEAIKAGMKTEDRQGFETALDDLTLALGQKDLAASLQAAIDLYREFGRVMGYFDYPLPQDYFQVRYQAMGALVEAYKGSWEAASRHMEEIEEPWTRLQTQMDKAQKEDADRTGYAIKDLALAVGQKDVGLTYIKGEIALKDLKKLEEKLSKKQG